MVCQLRKWRMEDVADLAGVISNPRILENLRDGIPYPYTETDGREFITAMLSVNEQDIFAFAITVQDRVIGSCNGHIGAEHDVISDIDVSIIYHGQIKIGVNIVSHIDMLSAPVCSEWRFDITVLSDCSKHLLQ